MNLSKEKTVECEGASVVLDKLLNIDILNLVFTVWELLVGFLH